MFCCTPVRLVSTKVMHTRRSPRRERTIVVHDGLAHFHGFLRLLRMLK
jgi:hypothetical protein